jgi:hypothetical protein
MITRTTLIVAATLAVFNSVAAAQETARSRAQEVLPPAVFTQIDAMAGQAGTEGIPGDLLFNKVLEGIAKRVPAERLGPAVEAYAGRLLQARSAFGPEAASPLLMVGADAIQRGVGPEALRLLGESPDLSPMAVLVLADLVESGVPANRALALVREALQRRTRERDMLGMPEQVRRLMRQGQSAQQAAEQVRRALGRGRAGGVGPPVPPGSEPVTQQRQRGRGSQGGGA